MSAIGGKADMASNSRNVRSLLPFATFQSHRRTSGIKRAPLLRPKLVAFLSAGELQAASIEREIGPAFALGVCQRARDKGRPASSDAFCWIFLSGHFPGSDQRICLDIIGRLPRESKCTWYESRAHYQPKRIQGNRQYAIQADSATQRT